MRPIYLHKEDNNLTRKILLDMAYLVTNNKIRLPKEYYEEGLYLPFFSANNNKQKDKFFLTTDKIILQDDNYFYFPFPFKPEQVEYTEQ